ncbi:MAG: 50S ribosomal protein L21e [Aigarchaeota archaeon]|nr:50S ribosomal protein L21e [Aigarchaeota archaeon]MDH5703536.1 50S ribosomal protein L21e [Aigarchaeota archaeon]
MPSSKGYRRHSRKLLTKRAGSRSAPRPDTRLRRYSLGERVVVNIEPGTHKGMPHRRYQGKVGKIAERRGRSYVVEIKVGSMIKKIIARPQHLKSL